VRPICHPEQEVISSEVECEKSQVCGAEDADAVRDAGGELRAEGWVPAVWDGGFVPDRAEEEVDGEEVGDVEGLAAGWEVEGEGVPVVGSREE
jgi:hypothetical protein